MITEAPRNLLTAVISPPTAHSNVKGVQIFNPTSSTVNMFLYDVFSGDTGVTNPTAVDESYNPIDGAAKKRFTLCWNADADETATSCMLNPGETMVLSSCSITQSGALNALAVQVPGAFATSPSYAGVTGDDWLVLAKLTDISSKTYTVVDVIGDYTVASSNSYSGTGSDGVEISTNNAGIKRVKVRPDRVNNNNLFLAKANPSLPSSQTLSSFSVPRTSWDTSEWTFQETEITASSSLDYMKYHFADMFECTQTSDCPTGMPSDCDVALKQCVATTDAPTDAPTQAPTEQPTQAPTQAPTPTAEYVCKVRMGRLLPNSRYTTNPLFASRCAPPRRSMKIAIPTNSAPSSPRPARPVQSAT